MFLKAFVSQAVFFFLYRELNEIVQYIKRFYVTSERWRELLLDETENKSCSCIVIFLVCNRLIKQHLTEPSFPYQRYKCIQPNRNMLFHTANFFKCMRSLKLVLFRAYFLHENTQRSPQQHLLFLVSASQGAHLEDGRCSAS